MWLKLRDACVEEGAGVVVAGVTDGVDVVGKEIELN